MNLRRFRHLTGQYSKLSIAVLGDFCLDRYLDIDPSKQEKSIETHLDVLNVVKVRAQAGAAGTVVNNLVDLSVGKIWPIGFCGQDGEGFELQQALAGLKGVHLDHFLVTPLRRTFCYCKPLVWEPAQAPRELQRLDSKNWTPTPPSTVASILKSLRTIRGKVDMLVVLEQANEPETGVVTSQVRDALGDFLSNTLVMADSRCGLGPYPPVIFKMNAFELGVLAGTRGVLNLEQIGATARRLAARNKREVIVTMAERGIIAAHPDGSLVHVPAFPLRGPIDVVGAGDAVTANAAAALSAGASLEESIELAAAGASIVLHQLGTTGSASISQLQELMFP